MLDSNRSVEVPRRHITRDHAVLDFFRPRARLFICHQRHGRYSSWMVTLLTLGLKNRGYVLGERYWRLGRIRGDRRVREHQESTETQHARCNSLPHRTLELGIDHDRLLSLSDVLLPIWARLTRNGFLASLSPTLYLFEESSVIFFLWPSATYRLDISFDKN